MEFDKSRVYTALSADELEVGDVVFAADTIADLKGLSFHLVEVLISIRPEYYRDRFVSQESTRSLAYLIAKHDDPYKEFKKAQAEGKEIWHLMENYKYIQWVSNKTHGDWKFNSPVESYSLTEPEDINPKVRLEEKEITWKDFKLLDKVRYENVEQTVTIIDPENSTNLHVCLSESLWIDDSELKYIEKLEG